MKVFIYFNQHLVKEKRMLKKEMHKEQKKLKLKKLNKRTDLLLKYKEEK